MKAGNPARKPAKKDKNPLFNLSFFLSGKRNPPCGNAKKYLDDPVNPVSRNGRL